MRELGDVHAKYVRRMFRSASWAGESDGLYLEGAAAWVHGLAHVTSLLRRYSMLCRVYLHVWRT
jgi:hypothetical protein